MKKILLTFCAILTSIPFSLGQSKKIAYIYGDVAEDGTIPSSGNPYDPMRLNDTGNTGCSQFKDLVTNAGYQITEHYDAATTFNTAFFNTYDVVIFGLHQELLTTSEKSALDTWINNGGSILFYSDSAAGGKYNVAPLGAQNTTGQTAVNNLVGNYGMEVLVDQGGSDGGIPIIQSGTTSSHPIVSENLIIKGEGVSPVVIDKNDPNYNDFEVLIPYSNDSKYLLAGSAKLDYLQGMTFSNPEYAALVIKKVGNGNIVGMFDRQPVWNNGPGADINDQKNKLILENVIKYLAGDLGNGTAVISATANKLVTKSGKAFLDGSLISGSSSSYQWSLLSGAGNVTFDNAAALDTNASFSETGIYDLQLTASNGASAVVTIEVVNSSSIVASIDCGRTSGVYNALTGITYTPDAHYTGGIVDTVSSGINLTNDDTIYKTARSQMTSYNIPVPNGEYLVLLQFAETYFTSANKRVFNTLFEGEKVSENLDVWAQHSARYTAYDQLIETEVSDGSLDITFEKIANNELLNAIVIVPVSTSSTRIQAENYDSGGFYDTTSTNFGGQLNNDGVDIGLTNQGDYFIGWIRKNEYLEYTIDSFTAQDYTFTFRVATANSSNKRFHIESDGQNISGTIQFNTGGAGWETWQDIVVPNIPLKQGSQTLRVVMDSNSFNIDYFDIEQ